MSEPPTLTDLAAPPADTAAETDSRGYRFRWMVMTVVILADAVFAIIFNGVGFSW